jgi:PilZ domain
VSIEASPGSVSFDRRAELIHQSVSIELRNRVRYRLSADAVFAWEGPQQNRLLGEGITRDISVAGAFIFTRTCPPVGATVELEVFLSSTHTKGRTVQIKTVARVIRVEHSATAEGFAASSRDFTLLFDSKGRNKLYISNAEESDRTEEETRNDTPAETFYSVSDSSKVKGANRLDQLRNHDG